MDIFFNITKKYTKKELREYLYSELVNNKILIKKFKKYKFYYKYLKKILFRYKILNTNMMNYIMRLKYNYYLLLNNNNINIDSVKLTDYKTDSEKSEKSEKSDSEKSEKSKSLLILLDKILKSYEDFIDDVHKNNNKIISIER